MEQPTAVLDTKPAVYTIMGQEVRLPVEVRDATAAVAYYMVSASAASKLIPPGLQIAKVLPGRTLCTIGAMDYKDNDLGSYAEVGITFFVFERSAGARSFMSGASGLIRGGVGAFIKWLPVNGEFTCEAGRNIWGFPKFLTEIELSANDGNQTATLRADGQDVLRQTIPTGGSRSMPEREQISYAERDGVVYRTPALMRGEQMRAAFRSGRLELGTHPIANELRTLGLPKRPLFSTYMGKMTGQFGAATPLSG